MKNPKVGDRVVWTFADGSKLKGKIISLTPLHALVRKDGEKYSWNHGFPIDQLRRLVPKKPERTYTEAEIFEAVKGSLNADTPLFWDFLRRKLREGSGK